MAATNTISVSSILLPTPTIATPTATTTTTATVDAAAAAANTITSLSLFWSILALLIINVTHPLAGTFGWPIRYRYLVRANPVSALLDTLVLMLEVKSGVYGRHEAERRRLGIWKCWASAMKDVVKMRMEDAGGEWIVQATGGMGRNVGAATTVAGGSSGVGTAGWGEGEGNGAVSLSGPTTSSIISASLAPQIIPAQRSRALLPPPPKSGRVIRRTQRSGSASPLSGTGSTASLTTSASPESSSLEAQETSLPASKVQCTFEAQSAPKNSSISQLPATPKLASSSQAPHTSESSSTTQSPSTSNLPSSSQAPSTSRSSSTSKPPSTPMKPSTSNSSSIPHTPAISKTPFSLQAPSEISKDITRASPPKSSQPKISHTKPNTQLSMSPKFRPVQSLLDVPPLRYSRPSVASPQPPSPLTAPRISASVVPSSPPLKPKSSILNIFKRRRKAPYVPALSPAIGSSTSLALYDGLVTDSAMRKTTETTPLENNITSTSSYSGMGSEISFTLLGSLESSSNGDDLDPISGPSPLSPSERVLNSDPAPTTPSTPIIVSRSTQTLAQTFISKSTSSPPSIPSTTSSPPPTISPSVSPVLAPTQPAIQTLPSITVPTQTSPAVSNPVSAIVPPTPEPTYQPSAPSYAPLAAIDHKFRLLLSIVGILQYTKLLGCHGITEYIVLATVLFAAWIIMDLVYLFGMWRLLRNQHSKLAAASDVQSEGENTGIPQRKRRDRLAFVIYLQFLLLVVALPVVLYYDLKPNTGSTRSTPSTNDESGHDNDEAPQQQSIIRASFQWPMHAIYVVVVDLPFLQWGLSWYDNLSLIDAISGILSGYKGFFEKMWPFSMGWAIFALLLISPGIKKESMKDIIIFVVSPTFIWILSVILLPFNITFIWLLGWSVLICWSIAWLCIIGVILYYIIRILWRPGTWLVIWGIRFLGWLFEGLKDGIYTQERKDVPGILKISTFLFWVLVLVHWGITFKREKTAKEDWTEYLP